MGRETESRVLTEIEYFPDFPQQQARLAGAGLAWAGLRIGVG